MKKSSILALSVCMAMAVNAQSKFDGPTAQLVAGLEAASSPASRAGDALPVPTAVAPDQLVTVIVTLSQDASAADISAAGYFVEDDAETMALVTLKASEIAQLALLPEVADISMGYEVYSLLKEARALTGVDAVQAGTDLGMPYTGEGVITGLMDKGLDVNHLAFTKDGEPRVKRFWIITGAGAIQTYDTPAKIKEAPADHNDETHGTHVLGIMAGGYIEKARVATMNNAGTSVIIRSTGKNPYYGVAYDSEIAACAGTLASSNITTAVSRISNYATEVGKPAVINISLGNNTGPHDGTDATSRYLATRGRDVIICMSAGNEGDADCSIEKKFTAADKTVKTIVAGNNAPGGVVDIWGSDSNPLKVQFVIVNRMTGEIKYSYDITRTTGTYTFVGSAYGGNYIKEPIFSEAFGDQASLQITPSINSANNRYNLYAYFNCPGGTNRNLVGGFVVEGEAGQTANLFCSQTLVFTSSNLAGFTNGTPDNSINGMACGENIISVGSFNSCNKWPTMQNIRNEGNRFGELYGISNFSSYGTTFDGRQLPDVVGPGSEIVSAYSRYYVDGGYDLEGGKGMTVSVSQGDNTYYWKYMNGTSMSSPFVAGVVALWLQADPTLNVDKVKEIMKKTCSHDSYTEIEPYRWGYGKIDALAGIKEILKLNGVNNVTADASKIILSNPSDRIFEAFAAGASQMSVQLHNLAGVAVASAQVSGDTASVDASALEGGLYILTATDGVNKLSRKVMVK